MIKLKIDDKVGIILYGTRTRVNDDGFCFGK